MVALASSHDSRIREFVSTAEIPWRDIMTSSMPAAADDMPRTEDEYYDMLGLVEEIVHGNVVLRLDKARSARAAAERPSPDPPEKPHRATGEKNAGNPAVERMSTGKVEVVVGSGRVRWWESAVAEMAEEHISPYKDVLEGWEQPGSSYSRHLRRDPPPATHQLSPGQAGAFSPPRQRGADSLHYGLDASVLPGPPGTMPRVRVYDQGPGTQDGSFFTEGATSPVAAHASRRMAALDESYTNLLQRTGLPVSPLAGTGAPAGIFSTYPQAGVFRSPEKKGGGWARPTSPTAAGMSLGDVSRVHLHGAPRGDANARASLAGPVYAWDVRGSQPWPPGGSGRGDVSGLGKARVNESSAAPRGYGRGVDIDGGSRAGCTYPDRTSYYGADGMVAGASGLNASTSATGMPGSANMGTWPGNAGNATATSVAGGGYNGTNAATTSFASGGGGGGFNVASATTTSFAGGGGYNGAGEQPLSPTALLRSAQQLHEQLRPRAVQRTPAARALRAGVVGEDRDRLRFSYNLMRLSHGALEGDLTRMIGQLEAERVLFEGGKVFMD